MSEKNQFYRLANLEEDKQVIASNPKFRTVYFKFDVGRGLPKHNHNGESYELLTGDFLSFDARIEHDVLATLESEVLVTISEALE